MTEQALREVVMSILKSIAPEVEEGELVAGKPLRDQVDLDSMDWLNFLVAIHERTAVDIPESDYARLATLDDIVAYLLRKTR
ncbi:MAG TPA: acyl carrier protein [Rhodocyclaceae bacterium]|nr:acyl carrier protein [Rhodocyclaceae bacterium]